MVSKMRLHARLFNRLKQRKRADIADSILLPEILEDKRLHFFASSTTYIICGFIFLFLIWFSVAEFKELVIAQGQIEPSGLIKNIHHLEGGKVKQVHVQEGELVEKGSLLVSLKSVGSKQDLKQLEARRIFLILNKIRLESLLHNRKPIFSKWSDNYPGLVGKQLDQYKAALQKKIQTEQILSSKIRQYKSEYKASLLEHKSEATRVGLLTQKLNMRQQLIKKGYATLRSVIEAKSELQLAISRQILSKGKVNKSLQLLKQAKFKLKQTKAENKDKLHERYSTVSRELLELNESIEKYSDRVDRLKVISPFRGIIQKVSVRAPGEVISPAGLVANIIAVDESMVAVVRFKPKDRAQFNKGDQAEIKVTAYDTNLFGTLTGSVKNISASILRDDKGLPYYKAYIELNNNYFENNGSKHFILPGMQVRAEIVTGAKSLMKYILKPIYRSIDQAFTEK